MPEGDCEGLGDESAERETLALFVTLGLNEADAVRVMDAVIDGEYDWLGAEDLLAV